MERQGTFVVRLHISANSKHPLKKKTFFVYSMIPPVEHHIDIAQKKKAQKEYGFGEVATISRPSKHPWLHRGDCSNWDTFFFRALFLRTRFSV